MAVLVAVVALVAVGVASVVRRRRHSYVPAAPATVSVSEPTVDTLESPRHAAEARAVDSADDVGTGGAHRRAV
jgi:hypothetical protein